MTEPTRDQAFELMKISMPPFEMFLEHCAALKSECETAGDLSDEKAALFDQYRDALVHARDEYESSIARLICEQFTADEVSALIDFYKSPVFKVVEKALALGPVVANVGVAWRTKVLESCPDTWKMLIENVAAWQEKNLPEGSRVATPNKPGEIPGADGWERIDDQPQAAEEFIPVAAEEEAELERMRKADSTS